MIERERLEELIKDNKRVYDSVDEKYVPLNSTCFIDEKVGVLYWFKGEDFKDDDWVYPLEDLFGTKEEAEWELEFGNITRTETLRLPNYTVAINYIDTDKFILADNSNFKFLLLSNPNNIIIINKQNGNQIFSKPLTKENYIEACAKAKELFLER